ASSTTPRSSESRARATAYARLSSTGRRPRLRVSLHDARSRPGALRASIFWPTRIPRFLVIANNAPEIGAGEARDEGCGARREDQAVVADALTARGLDGALVPGDT